MSSTSSPRPADRTEFEQRELTAVFRRPLRLLHLVLVEHDRLGATLVRGSRPLLVIGALAFGSVLFSVPYSAVLAVEQPLRVAVLFVVSLVVCLPSLQVFASYIGVRIGVCQTMALGLIVTCVASLFTFAFFPILWFLRLTMLSDSQITAEDLSIGFLVASLAAGMLHLFRCLSGVPTKRGSPALIAGWLLLLVFVHYRMARVLDLA